MIPHGPVILLFDFRILGVPFQRAHIDDMLLKTYNLL